ncbi:MAG: hypothetical protein ABSA05_10490 [Opitutaceae bacterium]|jgi:hypothetical protein
MKSLSSVRTLFGIAAAYDGLLGLAFLAAGPGIYSHFQITPPNHWGYVHFSAGILVIFGWMFLEIARKPVESRNLVPYGILLKICYVATVAWYWVNGDVPAMWKWFAAADAIFAVLFVWSLRALKLGTAQGSAREGAA